ncbi:MAG: hypothetical protein DRJ68_05005 [Thermoprotei archaeon]|nr:MAG: hypothetical protein DRJ68_05005 [Thermoprotei archaeon]
MMVKVVLPSAGLGTRLLPMTKELPKEMLPLFLRCNSGVCLKPILQAIFEQLYDFGFRDFCFIVGRGKRAIEDHFTPDMAFVEYLRCRGKSELACELESFYSRINGSNIVFINQPEPKGFGDAVLRAKPFIEGEFLVHAGDTYIISRGCGHVKRLLEAYRRHNAKAAFLVQWVEDPRLYGVIEGVEVEEGVFEVKRLVEKPEQLISHWAIMPIYIFNPVIFKALEETPPGKGGELQLTDGIQRLVDWGLKVIAVKLRRGEVRLDIGTPETCWDALKMSYSYSSGEA